MSDNFVKIDLHIHTPKSSECYKGNKNDEEYFRILKKAKKEKLKIIAFTDHNSIQGYDKLLELRTKLLDEQKNLFKITDPDQRAKEDAAIKNKLSLYQDILILPGIEFEVNNGIHLLVVFNNSVPIDKIQQFLIDGGYDKNAFGKEQPLTLSSWDIFKLYEESKKYDSIVIDAHTDSDKGIWNVTRPGLPRAECFRNLQLSAVAYKNEGQRKKIEDIIRTSQDYRRDTPLAFVRFSDAHEASMVGAQVTWVKLKNIDFPSLKVAFSNPSELVTTEEPSLQKILDALLKKESSIGISDLSAPNLDMFKKFICALSNSTGGHLLLGVTSEMSKVGLETSANEKYPFPKEEIKKITECFRSIDLASSRRPPMEINIYPLQRERFIISTRIPLNDNLVSIKGDGRIYSLQNKEPVVLRAEEIQELIEKRSIRAIESRVRKHILTIERNCCLVNNLFASTPILRKFEANSTRLPTDLKVEKSITISAVTVNKLKGQNYHGISRGNLVFIREEQPPRLQYTYLRYTAPRCMLRNLSEKAKYGEVLYIVPGGGVFYSNRNLPVFIDGVGQVLKLFPRKPKLYSYKFLTSFLKSSFLIWYVQNKMGNTNLFLPKVFERILIPRIDPNIPIQAEALKKIEENFGKITSLEKHFLLISRSMDDKDLKKCVEKHNSQIDILAYEIDMAIYKIIGLSDKETGVIEEGLRLHNIYIPKKKTAVPQKS